MPRRRIALCSVLTGVLCAACGAVEPAPSCPAPEESPYLFGLHALRPVDPLPEPDNPMGQVRRRGWMVFTVTVGADPADRSGDDFRPWSSLGYGVIVRINHGYGTAGTIPYSGGAAPAGSGAEDYPAYSRFAQRLARYVEASRGAHIWIIGNEANLTGEWPALPGQEALPEPEREPVTAERYTACFSRVREQIKGLPGHRDDQVLMQAIAPVNNELGKRLGIDSYESVAYYRDILDRLGPGGIDGMALHAYTADSAPTAIFSEQKTYRHTDEGRYLNFLTYRDSLDATPGWARSLPIYITETTPDVGWEDVNSGWIKNAYQQVDSWNARVGTQKIRALVLFIWSTDDLRFQIKHRPQAIQDFKEAMANPYRWTSSACPDLAGG